MSIKLMTKAWETNQKGNDLLVLLAMCDFASDEGVLFPSLNTLANKAKVAKSTLAYILNAYEDIGVITRTQRKRENKSDTSTSYQINHLNVDSVKYKESYQKARKYTKKPQCEHPTKNHNVDTQNEIVDTQNANCGHLEPSVINHQDINHHLKSTKKKSFIAPSLEEIQNYIKEKGLQVDGIYFLEYFTTGDWKDAKGNKVLNWKQKLLTWDKYSSKQNNQPQSKKSKSDAFIDDYFYNQQNNQVHDVEVLS